MSQLKPRVLVVDDNESDRKIVKAILKKLNYRVIHEAENATLASGKLSTAVDVSQTYDLVILDWNMPGGNGLKLLNYIHHHEKFSSKTKVIVMTATSKREVVQEAIEAGANDFILKPVEFALLKEKILKLK